MKITIILLLAFAVSYCHSKKNAAGIYPQLNAHAPIEGMNTVYSGGLDVWENRAEKKGRKINIHVTVIPAVHRDSGFAPIFFVEGGPGVAASASIPYFIQQTNPYRQHHDIVLVDVRGTGKSNALHCNSLQYKRSLQEQLDEMYPAKGVKECVDSLSRLADLTQYTTSNMADDIDDVRQWLGFEKIKLMGISYGTKLSQEYMRRHGAATEAVVLISPVIMNSRIPLHHAQFAQQALDQVWALCESDSSCAEKFPNVAQEFLSLMNKNKFEAIHMSRTGKTDTVKISWDAFQTKIRSLLYAPASQRKIPFIVHEAFKNNWQPFLELFAAVPQFDDELAEGLYLCVTCSEDIPFIQQDQIPAAIEHTFMKSYRIDQQQQACRYWSKANVPLSFLKPVESDIPTMIVSGGIDPVTPNEWARKVAAHLPNATLVNIPLMAHTFDGLQNEACIDQLIIDFFRRKTSSAASIDCLQQLRAPAFQLQ